MSFLLRLHSLPRERRRALWLWCAIPLLSFLWFWFWRSNVLNGGDSEQWEREVAFGCWLRKRQMLSFFTLQLAYQVGRPLLGWSPHRAINFVSCLAGALAMLVLWRMFRGRPQGRVALLVTATAGFTTIFYGHIETYAQPVAALLLHLLAVQRTVEGRWRPWTVVATFTLMVAFHLVALFVLPALLVVLWRELTRPGLCRSDRLNVLLAAIPGLLFWWAITHWEYGAGELVGPHFIRPLGEMIRHPWHVFTRNTVDEKKWFLIWNGGLIPLVAVWIFLRAGRRWGKGDRGGPNLLTLYLLGYFVCFLGFFAVWNPDAQRRDFDLFCFPWVIAAVAVSQRVRELPARAVWVGLILGVNFFLWLTRPVVFAEVGRRGHGTIVMETEMAPDERLILLDERLGVLPVNRFIGEGSHLVTAYYAPRVKARCLLNIRPGETLTLRLDRSGLHLVRRTGP